MTATTAQEITPGILTLLPMFYIGWSDSVLSPSEIALIHDKLNQSDFLTADEKSYLIKYTDPKNPPSAELFKEWVEVLRENAHDLDHIEKKSLVELGLEMALSSTANQEDKPWNAPKAKEAIQSIQTAMGLDNENSVKLLLSKVDMLGAYAFAEEYGGGGRIGDHITVFETLAYGDLSLLIKFGVQFGLFGGSVYNLGTEKHHRQYVEPLGKADLLGCFAMTETGHGSNVRGLLTTATYDHKTRSIVVHSPVEEAGKEYIGNALHSTMAAVFAQLIVDGENHGVHAILVPIRDAAGK